MSDQYSSNESFERIKRALKGEVISSTDPGYYGQKAWNESLGEIAQLIEGTTPYLYTPQDQYGEVWTWTGTVGLTALSSTAFTKITGTFQNYSDYLQTTPQPTQDRVLVTSHGEVFCIDWSFSFIGSPDLSYKIEPYYGGVGVPQAATSQTPIASGSASIVNMASHGYQYVSGTNVAIDLRVLCSATGWMLPQQATLSIRRMGPRVNKGSNGS